MVVQLSKEWDLGPSSDSTLVDTTCHLHVAPLSPSGSPLVADDPVISGSSVCSITDDVDGVIHGSVVVACGVLVDSLTIIKKKNVLFRFLKHFNFFKLKLKTITENCKLKMMTTKFIFVFKLNEH